MNIESARFDADFTVGRVTCLSLFPWKTVEKTPLNFHGTWIDMIYTEWVLGKSLFKNLPEMDWFDWLESIP